MKREKDDMILEIEKATIGHLRGDYRKAGVLEYGRISQEVERGIWEKSDKFMEIFRKEFIEV